MSQSTRNALKRIEMQKNFFYPFNLLRALRVAQSPSGEAQLYLHQITSRVPRSVHAKFHHDRIKTMGARGPMTNYAPSGLAQTPIGEAQPYLPHVTHRVPRSVHAQFHADWTKTVGAKGIHRDGQSYFNYTD